MQHERRRYPRVKRQIKLDLHRKRLLFGRGPRSAAEIVDVSRSGARIRTRVELNEHDRVVLVLKTKSLRPTLEFGGRVIWVRTVKGPQGWSILAGVKFLSVSAEMSSLLFRLAVGQMET
jgi:hypothetical protein